LRLRDLDHIRQKKEKAPTERSVGAFYLDLAEYGRQMIDRVTEELR
jgi:hypothetical protein